MTIEEEVAALKRIKDFYKVEEPKADKQTGPNPYYVFAFCVNNNYYITKNYNVCSHYVSKYSLENPKGILASFYDELVELLIDVPTMDPGQISDNEIFDEENRKLYCPSENNWKKKFRGNFFSVNVLDIFTRDTLYNYGNVYN